MTRSMRSRAVFLTGAIALTLVIAFGVFDAFSKGANDFLVFYQAWHLVLIGRGAEIYTVSPDRFLYGPGFAWCLAPLAALSKNVALAIWCAAKVVAVGFIAKEFSKRLALEDLPLSLGLSFLGVAFVSRPLLIDLAYGQVNLFILAVCVWTLLERSSSNRSPYGDVARWGILTWVALSKLFPIPLLAIPWLVTRNLTKDKIRNERRGIF
ncbi:MAG: glycosyltransferase family 87 protein, partial [Bdellovibrionia bacterium]